MKSYINILIPYEGKPYVLKNMPRSSRAIDLIRKTIDEFDEGIVQVGNNEDIQTHIFPLFVRADKRWLVLNILLRKYEGMRDKLCIFAPDVGWIYNTNVAILQVIPNTQEKMPLMGKIVIQIKESAMMKVCKDWENIFKEDDDSEEDS